MLPGSNSFTGELARPSTEGQAKVHTQTPRIFAACLIVLRQASGASPEFMAIRYFEIAREASHSVILSGHVSTGDPGFFVFRNPNPCSPYS